jgi:hypothetical protein
MNETFTDVFLELIIRHTCATHPVGHRTSFASRSIRDAMKSDDIFCALELLGRVGNEYVR